MKIITYLIIGIVSSITNILPLSYNSHLTLLQNLFNTKIFNYQELNNLFYLPPLIAIFITLINYHSLKHIKKNHLKKLFLLIPPILTSIFSSIIFHHYQLKTIPYLFIIIAILLIFTKNKNYSKPLQELTIKNTIFLSIFNLIPFIPPILTNLLGCYLCKLSKESSLKYAFTITFFNYLIPLSTNINYLLSTPDLIYLIISITFSTLISLSLIKYLINLINNNKLYKLSLYLIIIALFTLYWFR